jgi:hypothetical protein
MHQVVVLRTLRSHYPSTTAPPKSKLFPARINFLSVPHCGDLSFELPEAVRQWNAGPMAYHDFEDVRGLVGIVRAGEVQNENRAMAI